MSAPSQATVVLPVLDPHGLEDLIVLADKLARARGGSVLLLGVVELEQHQPLTDGVMPAQRLREELSARTSGLATPVRTAVRVARAAYDAIVETVREEQAALLVLGWQGTAFSPERLFGPPIDQLLAEPPCHLLVVKHGAHQRARSILLPTTGGPNLHLSSEVALALADADDGTVTILFATDPQHPIDPAVLQSTRELQKLPRVNRWLERISPAIPAILHEASHHDVIILGATGRRFNPEQPVGPLGEAVLHSSDRTVIITRRKLADVEQRAVERYEAQRDLSAVVDRWFAENTFSAEEFANLEHLLALKQRQNVSISLVLPALNEAATIGQVIDTLKGALHDQVPLLDEIVVIDSQSTDETRAIAAQRGIPVYVHQEILPHYGAFSGKGEALWKSLFVTRGDIVVWIDTDIQNIHPRFVYGLLGPLLSEPRLQFTKGFYRRPINFQGQLIAAGGGRVTELVARPLFNLFYPELSGFVQPLSGEYAGRRSVLERLPFFTGYGVETGLLIDLLHEVGLAGMAQVDLQQRIHRNQELHGLARMSFAIIQVVMQRLETRQRLQLLDPVNQSLKLIQYAEDGGFHLDVRQIRDHERPPIISIPEYAARRAH
ncbi:glucosyl-3-phosphoglycerate synthase [Kallotenue papyrolyticum]|uniref:glucosyl-3-phosphoglycerate synthase n=1 Tax=Kallotenue papyrolyticum TaxID=1325125 RepID=UPI000492A4BA|nr:glucosyl-3-phosphoglycerate synthase [Kallotenue papyrolyticum]